MARTKAFCAAAAGSTFTDYGDSYCAFSDGTMSGGFEISIPVVNGGPLIVLHADDLAAAAGRVTDAGGRISKPAFGFPGGQRFQFLDPDGHELAVWCKDQERTPFRPRFK
ncbi:MAG: hypothetical protein P1U65_16775 [Minwuia sp.]|nr:hypothetical protein [Minwuia sp.]